MFSTKRFAISLSSVALLAIGPLASLSLAANHYVLAGGTGSKNGADWTNAYSTLPTSLVRGDTYYVGGGSYAAPTFSDKTSGTSVITILHPTAANHGTDIGWQASYSGQAVFPRLTFSTGYYTFDGATGGGPGNWESGFGFSVQMPVSGGQTSAVSFGSNVANLTFRHTEFQGRGRSYTGGDTDLFYIVNPYTNITISYCYMHDTDRTMILTWPAGGNGFTLEYTMLARNGSAEHREAWSAGTDSNVIVRYNMFEDIMATGDIAIVNGNGTASNWDIYGNVFYWTGKYLDGIINTGIIVTRYDGGGCSGSAICVDASNWHFYNNVIANIANGSFTAGIVLQHCSANCVVENNIWYNNKVPNTSVTGATADYNWFYGNSATNTSGAHDIVGTTNPFVNWQAGNWELNYQIPGLALPPPYNLDPLGIPRGTGGSFDRGAYQTGSGTTSPALNPPTLLTVSVH